MMNMKIDIKQLFILLVATTLFYGCSDKDAVNEYDRPALTWYQDIVKAVATVNLKTRVR